MTSEVGMIESIPIAVRTGNPRIQREIPRRLEYATDARRSLCGQRHGASGIAAS